MGENNAVSDSPGSSRRSSTSSAPLPFPEPLPRSDFLAANFDPSAYLSSLGHRHQTLEDLRGDLRARSQLLSQELLELVNSHYNEFLSLGSSLKGGEEKVEELRVGLLSFRREVDAVLAEVRGKEDKVRALLDERRRVRRDVERAHELVEWDEHIASLESRLLLDPDDAEDGTSLSKRDGPADYSDDDSEDEDAADDTLKAARTVVNRVSRRAVDFRGVQLVGSRIGADHPFVLERKARLMRIRNTLLLDARGAQKQARACAAADPQPLLKVMAVYRDLDASKEAIDIIKDKR